MNKALLAHTAFSRPLFLTLCHMAACMALSGCGEVLGIVHSQPIRTRLQVCPDRSLSGGDHEAPWIFHQQWVVLLHLVLQ